MAAIEAEPTARLKRLGVRPKVGQYLRDLWQRREFAVTAATAQLKAENADTVLGNVWHLLNPLLLAAVFYVVFGLVFRQARGDVNYIAVLLTGILTFQYTAKSLSSGSRAIIANLPLIQSIYFPRMILPVSALISQAISHVPAICAMFVLVALSGERPNVAWLLVVPIFLAQTVFNFGLAMTAGRLTVHFRDIQNLLPFIIRMGMYTSGVFFTIENVPAGWPRTLLQFNPAYVFIALTREALLDGTTDSFLWLTGLTWAVVVAIVGFTFFFVHESEYAHV